MNVGLVAHDGKKNLMQNLCIAYQDILKKHKLYATSTVSYTHLTLPTKRIV